jgi:membrane protein implicated in regulation of membrane protease activity
MLASQYWLIIGVLLIIADIFSLTIAMLFAGLASLTIGGLVHFDIIAQDNLYAQISLFFGTSFIWGIALWILVKKLKNKIYTNKYNDIIGSDAIVEDEFATSQRDFNVKWSGTIMKARLETKNKEFKLRKGDRVMIVSIEGILLTVKVK